MKKLLLKLAFLFIPIILVLAFTNYNLDPGGKFSKQNFYKSIIKELSQGKNLVITEKFHNYLGSKLVMNLIDNQKKPKDTILIGSSRTMPVNSKMINQESFMNYGIHGARLGDLIAMYEIMREKDILPKRLIIDLSPLIFMYDLNPKSSELNPAFKRFIARIQGKRKVKEEKQGFDKKLIEAFNHYAELLSPQYFQQSLKYYFKGNKGKQEDFQFADGQAKNDPNVIAYDNSRFKPINKEKSPQQKIFDAKSKVNKQIFATTMDVKTKTSQLFVRWLQELYKTDMEIVFLVLPFDPYFYDEEIKLFSNKNVLYKTDYYLRIVNTKFKNHFNLIGSTNPKDWAIKHQDATSYYFDYAHLTSYGMTSLLSKIPYFNKKNN